MYKVYTYVPRKDYSLAFKRYRVTSFRKYFHILFTPTNHNRVQQNTFPTITHRNSRTTLKQTVVKCARSVRTVSAFTRSKRIIRSCFVPSSVGWARKRAMRAPPEREQRTTLVVPPPPVPHPRPAIPPPFAFLRVRRSHSLRGREQEQ